jgi:hypothetical protein
VLFISYRQPNPSPPVNDYSKNPLEMLHAKMGISKPMKPIHLHSRLLLPMGNSFLVIILLTALGLLSACGGSNSSKTEDPPPAALATSTSSLPTGQTGVAYSAVLAATGGTPPYMWTLTSGGPDKVVQMLNVSETDFSTPAFWQNTLYFFGFNGPGLAFTFLPASDTFNPAVASSTAASFSFPGSSPSVSSNGNSNGIVWMIDAHTSGTGDTGPATAGPAVLHAYDATNLGTELWNSSQVPADAAGNAVKFTVPTVANGKVYIGTRGNDTTLGAGTVFGQVDVYGLKPN